MKNFLYASSLVLLFSANAFAYKSGKLNCFFEIISKKQPTAVERKQTFSMDIMNVFEDSIESTLLDNKIHMRYTPGLVATKDVQVVVLDMAYNMANAGSDVPLFPNAKYTFKIGRQDSDLIGAFLNCEVVDLK